MPTWFKEECLGSTNIFLREKIRAGEVSTAVVWAREQTDGRGRLGRSWLSPKGGLFLSLSFKVTEVSNASFFSAVVGIVTAELLREKYGVNVSLKWPNDLVVVDERGEERKLGGILAEYIADAPRGPHVLVGLGMNVNVSVSLTEGDASLTPTALCEHREGSVDLDLLVTLLAERVLEGWALLADGNRSTSSWLLRWKELSCTLGRRVQIQMHKNNLTGVARDLSPDLALLLEDDYGHIHEVHTGDCVHLRGVQTDS